MAIFLGQVAKEARRVLDGQRAPRREQPLLLRHHVEELLNYIPFN